MMANSLYPYLTFTDTKAALDYYKTVFAAQDIQRLPVTPEAAASMNVPDNIDPAKLTMHAVFTILGTWIYASDNFNHDDKLTNSTRLLIDVDGDDAKKSVIATNWYHKITQDPSIKVLMPLANQGWGAKLAMFTDKYKITWMLQIK